MCACGIEFLAPAAVTAGPLVVQRTLAALRARRAGPGGDDADGRRPATDAVVAEGGACAARG